MTNQSDDHAEVSDILSDLFHGCALAAFVEQATLTTGWPDADATRRRAFDFYEVALANRHLQTP